MRRIVTAAVTAAVATATFATVGTGTALAAPGDWSNAPGYTQSISSGQPAGTLISQEEVKTPSSVKVKARTYVLTYEDGTGQITKETVIVPESEGGDTRPVLANIQPTDSLNPAKAPSRGFQKGTASVDDLTNEWLERDGIVVIPDSYGDQNPTYAGIHNGQRVKNGMLAVQAFTGQENPWVTAGFSGGGLDSARVAEDTTTYVPNYRGSYISGAPADMRQVVLDSDGRVQSGLIDTAAMPGVQRSLSDDDKQMLDTKIRPSVKVAFQVLQLGGVGSDLSTVLGVVGLRPDWLFTPGSFNDPEVQAIFGKASLGNSTPTAPVAIAGNLSDPWMQWDHNGKPLADTYQRGGADVTVMTSDEKGYPGHRDLAADRQLSWLNDQLPEGSKLKESNRSDHTSPQAAFVADVTNQVTGLALDAVSQATPAISEAIEPIVATGLDMADAVLNQVTPPAPAPAPAPVVAQQEVSTPVTPAPQDNVSQIADVATQQAGPVAAPVVKQVEDAVRSVPELANAINGLQLPALP